MAVKDPGLKFAVLFLGRDGRIYRYVKKHSTHQTKGLEWAWSYAQATKFARDFNRVTVDAKFFKALTQEVKDSQACPQDLILPSTSDGYLDFQAVL